MYILSTSCSGDKGTDWLIDWLIDWHFLLKGKLQLVLASNPIPPCAAMCMALCLSPLDETLISHLLFQRYYLRITVHVTRNFTKYDKFRGNSAWILCGFPKVFVQLNTELQYNFHGACLPFPGNNSSLSADLFLTQLMSLPFSVERLCCVRIWHTSFILVATYVCT